MSKGPMSTVHTLHPSPPGELPLTGARSPAGSTLTPLSLPAWEIPSGERDDRPFAEAHRRLDAYFAGRLPRFELPPPPPGRRSGRRSGGPWRTSPTGRRPPTAD
ncbi:hypothetical protein Shyhy01_55250 [Streptomyces hygroscopicus subsp. hygroscopicus]|nr:hypothetical protein [Streptomyces hygroscopicus]GLX52575.1 hypothetical protein Shyhy01_55250 [Streptomyces hygroscopicus subsp. hygroscopicus]